MEAIVKDSTPTAMSTAAATTGDDATATKRYERLSALRSKAMAGKGAWYWAHLKPVMVPADADSALPASAKLQCGFCSALFSASNPSRTAHEHLKPGICPNFSSAAAADPLPISSHPIRKRELLLLFSGGEEDLAALATMEDSVKMLKSPMTSPAAVLSRPQAEKALALLPDWIFESGGAVSFSALRHPKFQAFLHLVGLPSSPLPSFPFSLLEGRFLQARSYFEARLREAAFFQLASDGWKSSAGSSLVILSVNLPSGTTLLYETLLAAGDEPYDYVEELLCDAIAKLSDGCIERCAGVVADRFNIESLRNLENRGGERMVNVSCQLQAFDSLLLDFARHLPIFSRASEKCSKLANFVNTRSRIRSIFLKHQLKESGCTRLLRSRSSATDFAVLEDVMSFVRPIHLVVLDEDYKLVGAEEALSLTELIEDGGFWTELEAIQSLVTLVKTMAKAMETEQPSIGQCLPLWDELRSKIREWRAKFNNCDGDLVDDLIEKRFKKNYRPAWAAAFVLDPLFLIRDASGNFLPPFNRLSPEQDKDVSRVVAQLVPAEDAPLALMELMKWRSEGLDRFYAQAVQLKQRDPATGKTQVANPQSRRLVWESWLSDFKCLQRVASRLIFLHATAGGLQRGNAAVIHWLRTHPHPHSPAAQKIAFVTINSKTDRRDYATEEETDAELLDVAMAMAMPVPQGESFVKTSTSA